MSYTAPTSPNVNFSWQGAPAYTAPTSPNVNFIWLVNPTATGFSSTNFGTPTNRRTQPAAGFSSTLFGVPASPTNRTQAASGFLATHFGFATFKGAVAVTGLNAAPTFGTPRIFPYGAVGFKSTAFGAPTLRISAVGFLATHFGAVASRNANVEYDFGPATNFGTPSVRFDQTQTATGSSTTTFPTPTALVVDTSPTGRTVKARGARSTAFGVETALRTFTGIATGLQAIHFGAPAYHAPQTDAASGTTSTQFGTPVAVLGPHNYAPGAAGFKGTHFGHAVVGMTVNPFGFQRTRFGVPGYSLPGAHRAYGLNNQPGFGHPSARSEFRYPATGAAPSTRLGTPHATITHKARMTAPRTRFGVPLVKRNPTC